MIAYQYIEIKKSPDLSLGDFLIAKLVSQREKEYAQMRLAFKEFLNRFSTYSVCIS